MPRGRKSGTANAKNKPVKDQTPSQSEAQKSEQDAKLSQASPVSPIQVVRTNPESGSEEAEVVTVNNKPNLQESGAPLQTADEEEPSKPNVSMPEDKPDVKEAAEPCWNCGKPLNQKGSCKACGFEKNKLYNGRLEAEKVAERNASAYQY